MYSMSGRPMIQLYLLPKKKKKISQYKPFLSLTISIYLPMSFPCIAKKKDI